MSKNKLDKILPLILAFALGMLVTSSITYYGTKPDVKIETKEIRVYEI